jgi:hypothetical protein
MLLSPSPSSRSRAFLGTHWYDENAGQTPACSDRYSRKQISGSRLIRRDAELTQAGHIFSLRTGTAGVCNVSDMGFQEMLGGTDKISIGP